MKIKNKGKVYPSPSPSDTNVLSVLKLLPTAILALVSLLSIEDREVLAYMITRSIATAPPSSIIQASSKKKPSNKKFPSHNINNTLNHKPPMFDCDCFGCYTSYWFRWDSSPNRELIHQVIEAFEEHLANGEKSRKKTTRGKKKDRMTALLADEPHHVSPQDNFSSALVMEEDNSGVAKLQDNEAYPSIPPAQGDGNEMNVEPDAEKAELAEAAEVTNLGFQTSAANNDKGLARKVLPDVLGLLNSRLWNLWGPNV